MERSMEGKTWREGASDGQTESWEEIGLVVVLAVEFYPCSQTRSHRVDL